MQNISSSSHDTTIKAITPLQLTSWCDQYLAIDAFKDYCPNGLQIDADVPIRHLVTAVTASQRLIDAAIAANADAILVHHGYFWKGEDPVLTGIKGKRIRSLLQNHISLLAYHLPLDAHPNVGNNVQLAQRLGLKFIGGLYPQESHPVGNICECPTQTIGSLIDNITQVLNRKPLHLSAGHTQVTKIAICTGAAQDMIEQAAKQNCDVFISGEVSERTTHLARELNIDYLACGHHATETFGVQALGDLIAKQFGIQVSFIDDPNPV
ncbi:Nif3-like dinuclear metal center hexameric protein [Psychrobacter sp. I-STPA10]|uniref:Nif3-like dinuclear metal center hexameric protein n=1 Tax=Psychrobacter sp. I-STPA10 TaxID=2585769 RepID=UPI001E2F7145|nr:Nif3-like dinuclear metal center hexameric protein [Psychrobacter sp. I-STPA10]